VQTLNILSAPKFYILFSYHIIGNTVHTAYKLVNSDYIYSACKELVCRTSVE